MDDYTQRMSQAKSRLQRLQRELGEKHLSVADAAMEVGLLLQENGEFRFAQPFFEQALQIRKAVTGSLNETIAQCYYYIGRNYYELEDFESAEEAYKICLDCLGSRTESNFLATVYDSLAYLYHDRDKFDLAEPVLKSALAIRERVLDAWAPELADSLNHLGWLYSEHGFYDKAEPLFVRAIEISKAHFGIDHAKTAMCLENYAALLQKTGRPAEADKILCNVEWIRYRPEGR